jgi:hypothetical protein
MFLFYPVYFLDDWVGGTLLWKSNEAFLFSGWSGSGNHYTPFTLLVAYIPAYFGAIAPPDNLANSTTVFRITPESLKKYVIRGAGFRAYIPSGDTVYAWNGGPLWKWSIDHFERATADEEKKIIDGPGRTILPEAKDFSDSHGWSARHNLSGWPAKSEIDLNGKSVIFLMTLQNYNRDISVDVQLPGATRQRILHAESQMHVVSRSEYGRLFSSQQEINSH